MTVPRSVKLARRQAVRQEPETRWPAEMASSATFIAVALVVGFLAGLLS